MKNVEILECIYKPSNAHIKKYTRGWEDDRPYPVEEWDLEYKPQIKKWFLRHCFDIWKDDYDDTLDEENWYFNNKELALMFYCRNRKEKQIHVKSKTKTIANCEKWLAENGR